MKVLNVESFVNDMPVFKNDCIESLFLGSYLDIDFKIYDCYYNDREKSVILRYDSREQDYLCLPLQEAYKISDLKYKRCLELLFSKLNKVYIDN
jgi:hypothetical protein